MWPRLIWTPLVATSYRPILVPALVRAQSVAFGQQCTRLLYYAKSVSSRRFLGGPPVKLPGLTSAASWLASSGGHVDTGDLSRTCLRS